MQGNLALQIISSIAVMVLGLGGLIRGIQMLFQGRLDLVADWDNHPLPHPEKYAGTFSRIYIAMGSILLFFPTLLWVGLPILFWAIMAGMLVWFWHESISRIARQAQQVKE